MHLKWFKEGKQVRQMKTLTGAEIVIECLKEQGVDTVFGYPGGAILNIYDALYKHKDEITHILTSHEQGASHAADGYARATGVSPDIRFVPLRPVHRQLKSESRYTKSQPKS